MIQLYFIKKLVVNSLKFVESFVHYYSTVGLVHFTYVLYRVHELRSLRNHKFENETFFGFSTI